MIYTYTHNTTSKPTKLKKRCSFVRGDERLVQSILGPWALKTQFWVQTQQHVGEIHVGPLPLSLIQKCQQLVKSSLPLCFKKHFPKNVQNIQQILLNTLQNVQQNKILVIMKIRSSQKNLVIPIFINFPMISDGYDEKNDRYHKN